MSRATNARRIGRRRMAGFTLIELMVALGIFMVLGILSYRALSSIIDSRDRVGVEQRRWQAITRFMQRLELDLQQLPQGLPGALTYDPGVRTLRLVRLVSGPAGDEVRTIRYRWRDDVVERDERKFLVPEAATGGDQLVAPDVVLASVLDVEWRWSEAQPKSGGAMIWLPPSLTRGEPPPAAIQLRLKLTGVAGDLFRVVALR